MGDLLRAKLMLLQHFKSIDQQGAGLVNLSDFVNLLSAVAGSPKQILELLLDSGAGFVRYDEALDSLFKSEDLVGSASNVLPAKALPRQASRKTPLAHFELCSPKSSLKNQPSLGRSRTFARAANFENINMLEFQQPINCCNVTSVAYAMSIVQPSKPVSVNDIFHKVRLAGWFVTHDGMTLAETFNAGVDMAAELGGLFLECFHFDPELADYDEFKEMLLQDNEDHTDILIANFSVKIAHQWDQGGGHYAIIGHVDPKSESDSGDYLVTMAEVHPMKYGKTWTCSSRHLFDAMVDKDSDSKRARGMIRVATADAERHLPYLCSVQKSVCYCDPELDERTRAWLGRFAGNLPAHKFQMVLNMGGCDAAALALTGLIDAGPFDITDPDDIMWKLQLCYDDVLRDIYTAKDVQTIVNRFATEVAKVPIKGDLMPVGDDADAMLAALHSHTGPSGHDEQNARVCLILTDLNVAIGSTLIYVDPNSEAAKMSHFSSHWCVVVAADESTRLVTIACPRSKMTTRLWNTSVDRLWSGCQIQHSNEMVAVTLTEWSELDI